MERTIELMRPETICPEDGQPLAAAGAELTCPPGHRWRVHAGIPRMIPRTDSYADAFGLQWKVYRKVQPDEIWCEYGGNGVEARGRRPPS